METPPAAKSHVPGLIKLFGSLPVLGFFLATVGLAIFRVNVGSESAALLTVLNTVFLCAAPTGIALMAARAYRATGSLAYLLQGCGLVALAISSLLAGWAMSWSGDPNATVTLHNLGALIAGACHLASARVLIGELAEGPKSRRIKSGALYLYCGVGGIFALIAFLALHDALPAFFRPGIGPSPLRQCVLGAALCLFAIAGFAFLEISRLVRSSSAHWYGLGLWLIAIGLAAVLLQPSVGSALGWVGRSAQYLGSVYFFVAALRARKDTQAPAGHGLWSLWPELDQRIAERTRQIEQDNAALREEALYRLHAEAALKSKDRDLEQAQALAQLGSWQLEFGDQGESWSASTELRRIYGHAPDQPISMQTGMDLMHPADRAQVTENWAAFLRGENAGEWTHRILVNGRTKWVQVSAKLHRDSTGRSRRVTGVVQDVTASKLAAEDLRERERLLAQALDQAHIAHWALDAADRQFVFNDRFYALYGTTAEREGGYHMLPEVYAREFLPPEEQPMVAQATTRLLSGELTEMVLEHRIRRRDGETRHILVRIDVVRDAAGVVTGTRGTNQDITDLRRVETSLRESEELFRSVVTAMAEGVVVQRADGTIIDCNRQAEVILGLNREQIIGHTSFDPQWRAVKEDGTPFPVEEFPTSISLRTGRGLSAVVMGLRVPGGGMRWININSEPLPGSDRLGPRGAVCTFVDVTHRVEEQKRMRELLAQSDRDAQTKSNLLRDKEALLKEVNHRVKNNLQLIASLLRLQAGTAPGVDTRAVLNETHARISLVSQLHELLYRSANYAEVALDDYLRQIAESLLRTHREGTCEVRLVFALAPVTVATKQAIPCGLIVNELVTNSLKHAFPDRDRGEIRIALDFTFERKVRLTVSDDGRGLPDGFDPLRAESLGLQLVFDLSRQLGAECSLEQSARFSATFLPAVG